MNRQIFLCCISSILVIHSIDYETAEKNITNVGDLEDEYEKAYDEGTEVHDDESLGHPKIDLTLALLLTLCIMSGHFA